MAVVGLDRQLTYRKSPHGSLTILTVELPSFCDNQSTSTRTVHFTNSAWYLARRIAAHALFL